MPVHVDAQKKGATNDNPFAAPFASAEFVWSESDLAIEYPE